jgi:hypothetical protein
LLLIGMVGMAPAHGVSKSSSMREAAQRFAPVVGCGARRQSRAVGPTPAASARWSSPGLS